MSDNERGHGQAKQDRDFPFGLILVGIVGVILVLFIVSNGHGTDLNFLWLNANMPLWAVILIAGALGALIGWLVPAVRRGNKRRN